MRSAAVLALSVCITVSIAGQTTRPAPRQAPRRAAPAPVGAGEKNANTKSPGLPVSGPAIERGTVVIQAGKIAAVGAAVQVPAGARIVDATGKIVTPGWIESATQIGIVEIRGGAEGTDDQSTTDKELSAAFDVVDGFNGESAVIPVTRADGITRAVVFPAVAGHVLIGKGAMFDLSGAQVPAAVVKAPVAMFAALGEAGAAAEGGSRASAIGRRRV